MTPLDQLCTEAHERGEVVVLDRGVLVTMREDDFIAALPNRWECATYLEHDAPQHRWEPIGETPPADVTEPLPLAKSPAEIQSPTQTFRCEPLAAVIPAATCVRRQAIARGEVELSNHWGAGGGDRQLKSTYRACKRCPLGEQVRDRVVTIAKKAAGETKERVS